MKTVHLALSAVVVAAFSFSTVLACGGDKDCCKTKSTASKNSDKCCTPKTAKAKKADMEKSGESAKKS